MSNSRANAISPLFSTISRHTLFFRPRFCRVSVTKGGFRPVFACRFSGGPAVAPRPGRVRPGTRMARQGLWRATGTTIGPRCDHRAMRPAFAPIFAPSPVRVCVPTCVACACVLRAPRIARARASRTPRASRARVTRASANRSTRPTRPRRDHPPHRARARPLRCDCSVEKFFDRNMWTFF